MSRTSPFRATPANNTSRPVLGLLFASALLLVTCVMVACPALAHDFETTPRDNSGKAWRIGYYEGGPYFNYRRNLAAFARGLMSLGWLDNDLLPKPVAPDDSRALWHYLSTHIRSEFIEFAPDAFWSAAWDDEQREANRKDCIARLNRGEVDFIIAAGTWAGQDLATDEHSVPMTVFAVSDPVFSGIIESSEHSGLKHVHAKCDPLRYVRMARMFHNIVGFKRLGVTFEDSPSGRAHAGLREIQQVADEFGFIVVPCTARFSDVDSKTARNEVISCQEHLAPKVDAAIIPVHRGVHPAVMSRILQPYFKHNVPTFSQQGSLEVKHGTLMSMTLGAKAFQKIGRFHASVAASAFNGVNPGDLPLVYEDPRAMALNRETARRIGFKLPPSLVYVTEEAFDAIQPDVRE